MGCKICWKFELATDQDDPDNIVVCSKCEKIYLRTPRKKPDWIDKPYFYAMLASLCGETETKVIREKIDEIKALIRKRWGKKILDREKAMREEGFDAKSGIAWHDEKGEEHIWVPRDFEEFEKNRLAQ